LPWYKKLLENKLQIIVMEYELGSDDVRAFSLQTDICVIVLNEKDQVQVKLFSLFHEVCHLIRRQSGICSIDPKEAERSQNERFCDVFASEFLMPNAELYEEVSKHQKPLSYENVKKIAKHFGVSRQAMLIELDQRQLSGPKYHEYEARIAEEDEEVIAKRRRKSSTGGYRNWANVYHNRLGDFALRETETAFHDGRISYTEAMDILDLTSKYAKKFMGP